MRVLRRRFRPVLQAARQWSWWHRVLWYGLSYALLTTLFDLLIRNGLRPQDVAVKVLVSGPIFGVLMVLMQDGINAARQDTTFTQNQSPHRINVERGTPATTEPDSPRAREDRVKR